ncbi:MAG: DUF4389 domain-containing protein [Burkholderiaceae bacterium]
MTQSPLITTPKRSIWIRGLFMLLIAFIFQLSGTLLFIVAILQFAFGVMNKAPNVRLLEFGRSLGRYLQQITNFLTFVSEDMPFPFNDWPSEN